MLSVFFLTIVVIGLMGSVIYAANRQNDAANRKSIPPAPNLMSLAHHAQHTSTDLDDVESLKQGKAALQQARAMGLQSDDSIELEKLIDECIKLAEQKEA